MDMLLWVIALVCWAIAALLIASIVYPDVSHLRRPEHHARRVA